MNNFSHSKVDVTPLALSVQYNKLIQLKSITFNYINIFRLFGLNI